MKEKIQNVLMHIHREGLENAEWNFEKERGDWPYSTKDYYGTEVNAEIGGHIAIYVDMTADAETLLLNPDKVLTLKDDIHKAVAIWEY